ncbi:hypothetical protein [uncultured Clostridium sp.]|nr:hypothetical protein [uncultured Clostridium sp.]
MKSQKKRYILNQMRTMKRIILENRSLHGGRNGSIMMKITIK